MIQALIIWFILWYLIGVLSAYYSVKEEKPLTYGDLIVILGIALLGPVILILSILESSEIKWWNKPIIKNNEQG